MESNQKSDLPHVVLMGKKSLDRSKPVWSILIKGLSNDPWDASDDIRYIYMVGGLGNFLRIITGSKKNTNILSILSLSLWLHVHADPSNPCTKNNGKLIAFQTRKL